MKINRPRFYESFKKQFGRFTYSQYDGFEALLNEWERLGLTDLRWLAYILATVWHETGRAMQPIEEDGRGYGRSYGQKLDVGQGPGKRVPYKTPNKLFYGRGHTQNTWRTIYLKLTSAAKAAGKDWDFLNKPELLLTMEPSIWATFYAMTTGLYTGKALSRYFNKDRNDAIGARKIINGTDKANLIAEYYHDFLLCL